MERCVFITGADRGLGFELVKRFLSDGWTVFAGRHNPGWTWLDELSVLYPEKLQPVRLEIADDSSVEAAAAFVRGITPSLDIIVNNAAIGADDENPKTVFDDLNFETIEHSLRREHARRAAGNACAHQANS